MKKFMNWILKEESGQGMVEYGLIIVMIAIIAMAGLTPIGSALKAKFDAIAAALA